MSSSRGSSSQLNPFYQLEGLRTDLMEARSDAARVADSLLSRNAMLSQRVDNLSQQNRGLNQHVHDLLQENADMRRDQVVQLRDARFLIQNLTAQVTRLRDENRALKRRLGVPDSPPPSYQETVAGTQEVGAAVTTVETAEGGGVADSIDPQGGGAVAHISFQGGSAVVAGGAVSTDGGTSHDISVDEADTTDRQASGRDTTATASSPASTVQSTSVSSAGSRRYTNIVHL